MKSRFGGVLACLAIVCSSLTTGMAQSQYQYSTPLPPGIASPDKVETRLGTLRFFDGFPDKATVDKIYDNLDRRAVQAYLLAIPIVNQAGHRGRSSPSWAGQQDRCIWEQLMDSKTVELTANDNTVYSFMWLDTSGPPVVGDPPKVLGAIDDFWYRWVGDIGFTGPTRAWRQVPVCRPVTRATCPTATSWCGRPPSAHGCRPAHFLVDGHPSRGWNSSRSTKVYPLAEAANPPPMKFVDASGVPATSSRPVTSFLGLAQPGDTGRAGGSARPDNAGSIRVDRHRRASLCVRTSA